MDSNKYAELKKMALDEVNEYGTTPPAHVLDAQPHVLVNAIHTVQAEERIPSRSYFLAIAAAAIAIVSILAIWLSSRPIPLKFTFGENRTAGELTALIETPKNQSLFVYFDGGSQLSLGAKSETRVMQSNSDQVHVMLDVGNLSAAIQGNGHTQWSVFAGPYEILVIGTQFTVNWTPGSGTLDVKVTKGEVLVKGRKLNKRGVAVGAGNRFTVDGQTDSFAVYPTATPTAIDDTEPDNRAPGALQTETNRAVAPPSSIEPEPSEYRRDNRHETNNEWKKLFKARKYQEAVTAWKNEPGNAYGSASAEELYDLANAARYTRNDAMAQKALLTIRRKYSKSAQAEAATYLLGKDALELLKNPKDAERWFELYLRDYTNGPMAEKAMGRLMQLYKQSGRQEKSKQMATQYMKKYPSGIFAKIATSMQSE